MEITDNTRMEFMDITVVLVTFNRLSDLKNTLTCYSKQTNLPKTVIVVNNASSDGTKEYLDEWRSEEGPFTKITINSSTNLGGAGGFALGMQRAVDTSCDFVFISDDDAFPEPNMLEILSLAAEDPNNDQAAAYCTSVINHGKIDLMHRRRLWKKYGFVVKDVPVVEGEYQRPYFEVDYLTFVGALVKKEIIEEIGFPRTDYFIREDDSEYSLRIRNKGKILCITDSIMNHNTGFTSKLWLDYYTIRNNLFNIQEYFGKTYYNYAKLIWYLKRCSFIAKIIKGRTLTYRIMCKQAIYDADHGVHGYNERYNSKTEFE